MTRHKSKSDQPSPFENDDPDTLCGFLGWSPAWMQLFGNTKVFTIIFAILGILQGALFTYMIGIVSTIEKRFAFDSKVTGFILMADNISAMIVSPIVGYLGGKFNQSHLMAIGLLTVGVATLTNAVPFIMYGHAQHLLHRDVVVEGMTNITTNSYDLCFDKIKENCSKEHGSTVFVAVAILWLSSFFNGLGYTAYYTIGLPYLDDNVKKKNSPMYISTLAMLRFLGPSLGFVISSFSLSFYENPFINPGFDNKDPRWIGAWWLGFVILGVAIVLCTIPMFFFPKKFKNMKQTAPTKSPTPDGVWNSLVRLMKNKLLMFQMMGGTLRILGYYGYYLNKPKYMELQYRQSASSASLFTGATSTVVMTVGTMLGGIVITYCKPRVRFIAAFVVFVEILSTLGIFATMFMQCPTLQFQEIVPTMPGSCNAGCDCSTQVYQPVCGSDGVTNYFSPCIAGCQKYDQDEKKFLDCSCVNNPLGAKSSSWASNGLCKSDCNRFPLYIGVLTLTSVVSSTARTGDTLLTLRAVEPRDKSFAMGVIGTVMALFAYMPYPLLFGYIVDSTCLIWEKTCGKKGNCWLYDIDAFRLRFHLSALGLLAVGIGFQVGTIFYVSIIKKFYEDEDDENSKEIVNDRNQNELNDLAATRSIVNSDVLRT